MNISTQDLSSQSANSKSLSVHTAPAVESFIKKVSNLYEVEYGDFKRKVGQYILRLESELSHDLKTKEALKLIEDMKMITVYVPTGDIEETREKVLELARRLA